jgi:hypothetical protein
MKLVINDAGVLAAFTKVEGKEGVVQAQVLAGSTNEKVRLQALGGAVIELPVTDLLATQSFEAGQTIQFTANGWVDGFDFKDIKLVDSAKAEEVRKSTGGSSPAGTIAAVNRRLD